MELSSHRVEKRTVAAEGRGARRRFRVSAAVTESVGKMQPLASTVATRLSGRRFNGANRWPPAIRYRHPPPGGALPPAMPRVPPSLAPSA